MMLVTLAWRNLWRSRVRTLLTVASLAISLFLFTLLTAAVESMQAVAAASAAQLRLVVHHKTSVTKLIPLGHGPKIAALPDVQTVCGMRWFGGRVEDSHEQFPSMAVDPNTFPVVFDDFKLTAAEIDSWADQRTAAVLGVGLAERIGCRHGDRVVLKGGIPPYPKLEFRVAGITHAAAYPNVFVFRLDYMLDALRADAAMPADHNDAVNIYWVRAASPAALDDVRRAIDATFANSADATLTESEESFVAQFTRMFGDIPRLVRNVGLIVIASILLVVWNTLSTAVRERKGELAVMKAIGFTPSRLHGLLLAEATLMGLLGGIGSVAALLALGLFDSAGLSMPYFPIITISPAVAALGVVVSVVVNLAAAAVPARIVSRLSVSKTLRDFG